MNVVGSEFLSYHCLEFNGVDQYAYCDNPSFGGDTVGALSAWMRYDTVLITNGVFRFAAFAPTGSNNSQLDFSQRRNTSGNIAVPYRSSPIPEMSLRSSDGAAHYGVYGDYIYTVDDWHHIVMQFTGSAFEIYLNGVNVGATPWMGLTGGPGWFANVQGGTGRRFTVGALYNNGSAANYTDGCVDEMTVFNRPLTSTEVAKLYGLGAPRNPLRVIERSAIVSHWRMGESGDSATTVFDQIGSNDLTLVNSPIYGDR